MPSADPDLVRTVEAYFKSEDAVTLNLECSKYLSSQGYREERLAWHPKEGVATYDDMTQQEYDCMCYLMHEWDWGGFIK